MPSSDDVYRKYDKGVRFAVRVLNAAGIHTTESCQGGEGHCGERPWVIVRERADLFHAVAVLASYGLQPMTAAIEWYVEPEFSAPLEGARYRITLREKCPKRADEQPMFLTRTETNPDA